MKTNSSLTSASAQAARKSRALIVPAEVLALPDITLTAKLLLAEVVDLYKVNRKVFASDEHFALRLGIGIRTVGDAIKQLHGHGLLTRSFDPKARQKRLLIPTLPTPGSASVQEKSLRNPQRQAAAEPADSAESACEFRNESLQNPQEVPAKSADINTRVNTKVNSNQTPVGGSAAWAAPQKKLEIGRESASAEDLTSAPSSSPVAAAPPSSPFRTTRLSARRTANHAFADSPFADFDFFAAALQGTDYVHADSRYYHELVRAWAESKDVHCANWLAQIRMFMLRDVNNKKLKTSPSSFATTSHACNSHLPVHRYESLTDLGTAVDQYVEAKYGH